jgi:Beta-ketoacyl synthase, N-terminal domain
VIRIYVEGIGICGPGLNGWEPSLPVLAGLADYVPAPITVPPGTLLPANERRRAVQIVKIALAVGSEAFAAAGRDPAETATVFASSGGDGDTIHEILNVLASPDRELSPTRFHNSVHNTAAGYWSIATGSRAASSSLCCHDDSFAAGLLEAAVQAVAAQHAVGLITYDVQYPAPLSEVRSISAAFAVALVLSPAPTAAALACVELELRPGADAPSTLASRELEMLRRNTPAARSLPLLAALARRAEAGVTLNYLDDMVLALRVTPHSAGAAPGIGQSVRSLS